MFDWMTPGIYFMIGGGFYLFTLVIIFLTAYAQSEGIDLISPFNAFTYSRDWSNRSKIDRVDFSFLLFMVGMITIVAWPIVSIIMISLLLFTMTKDLFIMFFAVDPDEVKGETVTKSINLKKRAIMWLAFILYIGALPIWLTVLPDITGALPFSVWYAIIFVGHIMYITASWTIIRRAKK